MLASAALCGVSDIRVWTLNRSINMKMRKFYGKRFSFMHVVNRPRMRNRIDKKKTFCSITPTNWTGIHFYRERNLLYSLGSIHFTNSMAQWGQFIYFTTKIINSNRQSKFMQCIHANAIDFDFLPIKKWCGKYVIIYQIFFFSIFIAGKRKPSIHPLSRIRNVWSNGK